MLTLLVLLPTAGVDAQLRNDRFASETFNFDQQDLEPFGAEDHGTEDNDVIIPEPLVFDLVRALGAHQGEFEANVLAEFPLRTSRRRTDDDDDPDDRTERRGIEWAPEIEYAVWDGFAVEFELPYEDRKLEAYKAAAQLTFGTALDNRFIHGTQVIVEPDIQFHEWEVTGLYIAGLKLNRTWSLLGMIGLRSEIEEGDGVEHTDGLLNFNVFANLSSRMTVGLEADFVFGESERTEFLLMPQLNYEITDNIQLQVGSGVDFTVEGSVPITAVRLVYDR